MIKITITALTTATASNERHGTLIKEPVAVVQ